MKQTKTYAVWLCLLASLAVLPACYKATFNATPSAPSGGALHDEWTDFFIFGLVGEQNFDAPTFCPNGVAQVRTGGNFGTGLVSVLTIGIYTPRKVYIRCNANTATATAPTSYTIDADKNGQPVRVTRSVGSASETAKVTKVSATQWKVTLAKAEVQ